MKKTLYIFLAMSMLLAFTSCKDKSESKKNTTADDKTAMENKPAKKKDYYMLPPLNNHIQRDIYDSADYLDIIFDDLDFSMSLSDNKSIRGFLNYINFNISPHIKPGCKPMGHFAFVKRGNTIIEGEFYHSPGCYYFVFQNSDGENVYANAMSQEGIDFFNNIKHRNFKPAGK